MDLHLETGLERPGFGPKHVQLVHTHEPGSDRCHTVCFEALPGLLDSTATRTDGDDTSHTQKQPSPSTLTQALAKFPGYDQIGSETGMMATGQGSGKSIDRKVAQRWPQLDKDKLLCTSFELVNLGGQPRLMN